MAKKKDKVKTKAKKTSKKKKEEVLETIELNQNTDEESQDLDSVELAEGEMLVTVEASDVDEVLNPEEAAAVNEEVEAEEMLMREEGGDESDNEDVESSPTDQTEMSPADLEPEDEDDDLDEECTFDLAQRKRVIEAVLFVSDKSVGMSTLKAAFGIDSEELAEGEKLVVNNKHIKEGIEALEQDYIENNRGFRMFTVDGGYQIRTADDLKPFLQNTIKARSFRLTGPSLETLAMIAYKQPCTKSQIDDIRGVDSSHLVRALMDRGMVSFAGKSELPGKPMLYKTTSKFLDIFGLRNLKELPNLAEIEALLPEGIGEEEEEKETLSDLTGKLSEQFEGEYSASEEELGKISDQLSTISTETDFFEQEKQRQKEKKEHDKAESLKEALMVGEEISTRDRNWLERYEAALLEAAAIDGEGVVEAETVADEQNSETQAEEAVDSVQASDSSDEEALELDSETISVSEEQDLNSVELSDGFDAEAEADLVVMSPESDEGNSEPLEEDEIFVEVTDGEETEPMQTASLENEELKGNEESVMEDEEKSDLPPLNENV